jgi:hypothetical protein
MNDILGTLGSGDKDLVDAAYTTLERVRRVTVRLRAAWMRLDDLPPEDEASLKAVLHAALEQWAARHGVASLKTDGPGVEVTKAEPYIHLDL